jgi:hypothetical protein
MERAMNVNVGEMTSQLFMPRRRQVLTSAAGLVVGAALTADAGPARAADAASASMPKATGKLGNNKIVGFMLAHEQFTAPRLTEIGAAAAQAGFGLLATSDHFQPWQANEAHAGEAWVTLGALGGKAEAVWIGTTVTCPILRYNPAVVAETWATLAQLYPGRVFLGVGSGEALNEKAATGDGRTGRNVGTG